MKADGYTSRQSQSNLQVHRVIAPDGGTYHFVQLAGKGTKTHCMCRFFANNARFGTCKHIEWLKGEMEAEARADDEPFILAEIRDAEERYLCR